MYQKIKITALAIVLTIAHVGAQDKWSLDDCVSYALQHNLQLKDFQFTEASNKETYRQSIRNVLPSVNGFSSYNIRFGRSVDPNDNSIVTTDFFSNSYSIESSIDLFQGFQKINEIKASKFLFKATKEEALQQKFLLAFRVMSAFYDIEFFEGLLAISKEQQAVSQQNFDLVKRQIDLGLKAGADLYEAESLLLTDKLSVTQSANSLKAAKLVLIQEMNLEGVTDISIQTNLGTSKTNREYNDHGYGLRIQRSSEFHTADQSAGIEDQGGQKADFSGKGHPIPIPDAHGGIWDRIF